MRSWAPGRPHQSEPLDRRAILESHFEEVAARFDGRDVPRPPWWGGFCVRPAEVEFWQGRANRLHDRLAYRLADGRWQIQRLSP